MLAFDASATGGYRDMLLNLRCEATGHIVEVQITLDPLLAIKAGGGHANYQIARTHNLFEKTTYRHEVRSHRRCSPTCAAALCASSCAAARRLA